MSGPICVACHSTRSPKLSVCIWGYERTIWWQFVILIPHLIWHAAVIAIPLQIKSYTRTLIRLDKLTLSSSLRVCLHEESVPRRSGPSASTVNSMATSSASTSSSLSNSTSNQQDGTMQVNVTALSSALSLAVQKAFQDALRPPPSVTTSTNAAST